MKISRFQMDFKENSNRFQGFKRFEVCRKLERFWILEELLRDKNFLKKR